MVSNNLKCVTEQELQSIYSSLSLGDKQELVSLFINYELQIRGKQNIECINEIDTKQILRLAEGND